MHVVIFGAGAQGRVALDILQASNPAAQISFVDENPELAGCEVNGRRVLAIDEIVGQTDESPGVVIAVGEPPAHLAIAARLAALGLRFVNAVHPTAVIAPTARLGFGNIVGPGVVIDTDSVVADHCILNPGALIAHDCSIGSGVLLGPGAHIGGRVTIGDAAFVGMGANVVARTSIGEGAVVGSAASVIDDVAPRVMVMGSPARLVWPVDDAFDWSRLL